MRWDSTFHLIEKELREINHNHITNQQTDGQGGVHTAVQLQTDGIIRRVGVFLPERADFADTVVHIHAVSIESDKQHESKPEQREQVLTYMIEKHWNVIQADEYIDHLMEESHEEEKPKKFLVVKDVRIFFNTISKAIDVMKRSGIAAVATKHQKDDCIEYVVRIPLDCAEQKG